jgi:tRNA pseudouridine38-40 synthase
MAVRNIKLTIHYDGSGYHGWQVQPRHDTIQRQVEIALERLFGVAIKVTGASRTDAGVSAKGQVANFFIDSPVPTENIARAASMFLPKKIAIADAVDVDKKFNAIGSAKNKMYRYTTCVGQVRPVLNVNHRWHCQYKVDSGVMAEAAKLLVGTMDYKSFATATDKRKSSVRTVRRCDVFQEGDDVMLEIEGNGFLYNMVRNIMGTLVEVGRGRWGIEKMKEIIQAKNREAAGPQAPAAGLCLMRIDY